MTYDDTYNVIARYAPELLASFADKFSRFPVGGNAYQVSDGLGKKASFYKNIDKKIAEECESAAKEVKSRA
jgi:hypothetical protein